MLSEPHLSRENIELHHGKHHNAYVVKLNELRPDASDADPGTDCPQFRRRDLQSGRAGLEPHLLLEEHEAQGRRQAQSAPVAAAIDRDFGSYEDFARQFTAAALGQFGSGWAWLVVEGGRLKVTSTGNADLPQKHGQIPLLTIDVWEHAYYPSFRNLRPLYVEAFLANLVNWDFASENLARAALDVPEKFA